MLVALSGSLEVLEIGLEGFGDRYDSEFFVNFFGGIRKL
jgi:hypothetical protein